MMQKTQDSHVICYGTANELVKYLLCIHPAKNISARSFYKQPLWGCTIVTQQEHIWYNL